MKRALYVVSATLAAAVVAFYVWRSISYRAGFTTLGADPKKWYVVISSYVQIGIFFTFALSALFQLKKSTPRLLLLLSGVVVFGGLIILLDGQLIGLILAIAGIIPAILEISRVPRPVDEPLKVREKYDGLLIAAGVFALLCTACSIVTVIQSILIYTSLKLFIPTYLYAYAMSALRLVQFISLSIFCFRKQLRASVLYRMFFVGSAARAVLLLPLTIVYYSLSRMVPLMEWIDIPLFTGMVLLLIHTAKTRKSRSLPWESKLPEPCAAIPASEL